ncbi:hypothetical protein, partial [Rhodococcus globerulus]
RLSASGRSKRHFWGGTRGKEPNTDSLYNEPLPRVIPAAAWPLEGHGWTTAQSSSAVATTGDFRVVRGCGPTVRPVEAEEDVAQPLARDGLRPLRRPDAGRSLEGVLRHIYQPRRHDRVAQGVLAIE